MRSCREPPGLGQQLYAQLLARPIICESYNDPRFGHVFGCSGPDSVQENLFLAVEQTDASLKAACDSDCRTTYNSVQPFAKPHVCPLPCVRRVDTAQCCNWNVQLHLLCAVQQTCMVCRLHTW
jgi:hypothetical protein